MKLQSTTDYNKFLSPVIQRDVRLENVAIIKDDMRANGFKRSLHLIVRSEGGKLRIIHGQHRYLAARELGIEIWYLIDNDLSDDDAVDTHDSRWTRRDVVQGYASAGNAHYAYLLRFAREHKISASLAAALLHGNASIGNRGPWLTMFNNGEFKVSDQNYAIAVVDLAKSFAPFIKWWNEALFVRAVAALLNVQGFKPEHLKKRIPANASLLMKKRTIGEYVSLLETIYNARSRADERLNILFLYQQYVRNQKAQNLETGRSIRLDDDQKRRVKQSGILSRLING